MKNRKISHTVFGQMITSFMLVALVISPLSVYAEDSTEVTSDTASTTTEVILDTETSTSTDTQSSSTSTSDSLDTSLTIITPALDLTHSCVTAGSLGDSTVEPIVHGSDAVSLQDVFNTKGINKNVIADQKQYQVLNFNNASTTFTFEFISRTASYSSSFGYYTAGNIGSFAPVFNSGTAAPGFSTSTTVLGAGSLGFAVEVDQTSDTWGSENSLNSGSTDQAAFYELANNTFVIAFEDLPYASSDKDYNDLLVKVTVNCSQAPVVPPPPVHTCMLPSSLSDTTSENVMRGSDTYSLQDIFTQNSISKNVNTDQKQYQEWGAPTTTTSVKFDFVSRNAALDSVFGYYTTASTTVFNPVFRSGSVTGYASTTLLSAGQSVTVNIPAGSPIGLAIKTSAGTSFYTHNALNEGSNDHAVVYETAVNTYAIAFEDLPFASSDKDYNDLVIRMTIDCGTATSTPPVTPPATTTPTVTLTANPTSLTSAGTSTLSWISTNTTSCSASWTTATSTSGNQIVTLATTTNYGITCTGSYGPASATTTVTISPASTTTPPVTPPGGGGNGGGGNSSGGGGGSGGGSSSSGGRRHDITSATSVGEVLGVSTTCSYLRDFLRRDWDNDKIEMLKLQSFLNAFEKESLMLNATFDQATFEAVSRFQNKYFSDILEPWGHTAPTGFVYILTKKKINEIYCNTLLSLNQSERDEIAAFRAFILSHPDFSVNNTVGSSGSGSATGTVGSANGTAGGTVVPTPGSIAKSVARNLAVSVFSIPQNASGWIMWLIIILILAAIISAVTRFLRREKVVATETASASLYSDPVEPELPVNESPIEMPGRTEDSINAYTTPAAPDEEIIIDDGEEELPR